MSTTLFQEAYPLARRAAQFHSAKWWRVLRSSGFDSEDFEAACILKVWRKIGRFDPGRSSLRTFIERVVASESVSFLRRCRRHNCVGSGKSSDVKAVRMEREIELRVDVRRALATLDGADQKVARMLIHWTPTEIAKIYGISRAAVYRSIQRTREALIRGGI